MPPCINKGVNYMRKIKEAKEVWSEEKRKKKGTKGCRMGDYYYNIFQYFKGE